MQRIAEISQGQRWAGYVFTLLAVALISLFIGLILRITTIANISLLYIVAVLASAILFGRGPAIVASVAAFLIFDWFFIEPLHTFTVSDPTEWVALLLFLAVAVTTGQLAAQQRRQAHRAEEREREAVLLYGVARLLVGADLQPALQQVAERLNLELGSGAVAIDVPAPQGGRQRVVAGEGAPLRALQSELPTASHILPQPSDQQPAWRERWVRVVRPQRTPPGEGAWSRHTLQLSIAVRQHGDGVLVVAPATPGTAIQASMQRVLLAVATQIGGAVERQVLRQEALDAEVLRRTDELRSALLSAVSHDFRTPLASIIASAGSLRQHDVTWTDEERAEFAEAIENEAKRLNRLVGNLLDLSRIEAGALRPEKNWYDLGALIDDVLGRLRFLTAGRTVTVDIPADLPPISLDYVEIDQVLSNLVENAVKHTPPGTPITVQATAQPSEVRVECADRGPGIPPESLSRLFDAFYRVGRDGRHDQGIGLGLAVARGLVEAHGGHIWAENRADGGARVVFTLPVTAAPAEPAVSEGAA